MGQATFLAELDQGPPSPAPYFQQQSTRCCPVGSSNLGYGKDIHSFGLFPGSDDQRHALPEHGDSALHAFVS